MCAGWTGSGHGADRRAVGAARLPALSTGLVRGRRRPRLRRLATVGPCHHRPGPRSSSSAPGWPGCRRPSAWTPRAATSTCSRPASIAGGRLATERIDGFVVDRGFQVLNTGYPRAADLDLDALDLGWFERGAVVRARGPGPPGRSTRGSGRAGCRTRCRAPIGGAAAEGGHRCLQRPGRLPARVPGCCRHRNARRLRRCGGPVSASARWSASSGRSCPASSSSRELTTSSRYLDLLWRSLRARERSGCRRQGMQAVGEQLAARLAAGRLHLGTRARSVRPGAVRHRRRGLACGRRRRRHRSGDGGGAAARSDAPTRPARSPRTCTCCPSPLAGPADRPGRTGRAAGQHRRRLRRPAPLQPRRPGAGRQLDAGAEPGGRRPRRDRPGHGVPATALEHLTTVTVPGAQPAADSAAAAPPAGRPRRRPVRLRRPPGHAVHPGRDGQRRPRRPAPSCGRCAPPARPGAA